MVKFKDECLEKNTAVHITTAEQDLEFRKWMDSRGRKWCNGKSYLDESDGTPYKNHSEYGVFYPSLNMFGDNIDAKNEGYKILSYEEALLEEYSLPVIDPSKCKKYHVWGAVDDKNDNIRRYVVCIIGGYIYCVPKSWEQEFLNGGNVPLTRWKHWEEIKEDTKDKEIKDQIAKLKAEIEKLEGMCSSTK